MYAEGGTLPVHRKADQVHQLFSAVTIKRAGQDKVDLARSLDCWPLTSTGKVWDIEYPARGHSGRSWRDGVFPCQKRNV